MPKIVIDASVVVKWFLSEEEADRDKAKQIYALLQKNELEVWAPSFLLLELTNVLLHKKNILHAVIQQVTDKLQTSGITFVDFEADEIQAVLELAATHSLTIYDGVYLLLAKQQQIPLITADKQLLKAKEFATSLEEYKLT